jgi:exosortase D (VPLPA-CTERM-specific)
MANNNNQAAGGGRASLYIIVPILLSLLLLMVLFYQALLVLEHLWSASEEYNHGYMIPFVALFLFYQKLPRLLALDWRANWLGPLLMAGALLGWLLGEMSSLFIIEHYAFLLALFALAVSVYGWQGFKLTWAAFAYLAFMIPLPVFLYQRLSEQLQLISTEIGVAVIRLLDIKVYVSGNVIDLGIYQLQVAEACSGLRYLFPLMSFGFLIAAIYRGPNWHKWVIFLSTIPITILMNSFRIGVIGVTVEYWGIEMAEGFLHDFEGWFVFMASLGVLCVVIILLNYITGRRSALFNLLDLAYPTVAEVKSVRPGLRLSRSTIMASTLLLVLALPVSMAISMREEITPQRTTFGYFPLLRGDWAGREHALQPNILEALDHPDYIQADFRRVLDVVPVNFYVAYYESQRAGASIHSPRSCIPGGGWLISNLTQENMGTKLGFSGLEVNRLVISQGDYSQLVYYWFDQRGRVITNEYLAKWYLFQDGLTMQRSDGALVRLTTPVPPGTDIAEADARLQDFLQEFYPIMSEYLPGAQAQAASTGDGVEQQE